MSKERFRLIIIGMTASTVMFFINFILLVFYDTSIELLDEIFYFCMLLTMIFLVLDQRERLKQRDFAFSFIKNSVTSNIRKNITDCLDEMTKSLLSIEDAKEQITDRSDSNYKIAKEQSNIEKQITTIKNIIAKMETK